MTGPVLSLKDLRVGTAGADFEAVRGISLDIVAGEVLAVVGESGSGKTATGRALLGLLPPGLQVLGGQASFEGRALPIDRPRLLRPDRGAGIGMVFQEPMTSLNPALTIGRQMAEGMRLHLRLPEDKIRARSLDMLKRVAIERPEDCLAAYPHEFSGGMRQRIMLASVMALRPKLLIADEPTTALDTLSQAEVLSLMMGLTAEHGTAVIFITHNLGLVARYAQRAVVMHRGEIVETGTARQILTAPQMDYTRGLVDALPRRAPARPPVATNAPLIEARDLSVRFEGRRRFFKCSVATDAVRGVSLQIMPGEVVALVGGSGSGKTTLGRAMLRLLPASGGQILYKGRDLTALEGAQLLPFRRSCQIVFQDPYSSLDPRMRIGAIVGEALRHDPQPAAERDRKVQQALDEVALGGLANRFAHEMSGGQRQRVAIARALIRKPDFIVADEPVSALDMTIQKQILALLRDLQAKRGFSCLFVSHDLAAVEEIADRIMVMHRGEIVEMGRRDDIFDRPQHPYTRALLDASPRMETVFA